MLFRSDPYQLARLSRGTFGKATQFLEFGTFDFKTYENNGPSLKDILQKGVGRDFPEITDVEKVDLNGFRAYIAAKRAVELDGRGIESGFDIEAAKVVVKNGKQYEAVARELLKKSGLRVITHNLHVASLLSEHPNCKVHVAGGVLRSRDSALEGDSTVAFLKQFKVDYTIMSTMGIDEDGTLRDRDLRELPVAQTLVEQARETWLVADVSKFSEAELAKVGHLQTMKRVFTDALPPAPYPKMLQEWDVGLTIAS